MNTRKERPVSMTAAERRFAREMQIIKRLSLNDLLTVERNRMAVGV
jgi:hypothetical protein